jgi:hypothetical protein
MSLKNHMLHSLGLGHEHRCELSDLIVGYAIVKEKRHLHMATPSSYPLSMALFGNQFMYPCLDDWYDVILDGFNKAFEVRELRLFAGLCEGEKILAQYREMYDVEYDLLPPDYDSKCEISRVFAGYVLEDAADVR